jgi:hypothetical protein
VCQVRCSGRLGLEEGRGRRRGFVTRKARLLFLYISAVVTVCCSAAYANVTPHKTMRRGGVEAPFFQLHAHPVVFRVHTHADALIPMCSSTHTALRGRGCCGHCVSASPFRSLKSSAGASLILSAHRNTSRLKVDLPSFPLPSLSPFPFHRMHRAHCSRAMLHGARSSNSMSFL